MSREGGNSETKRESRIVLRFLAGPTGRMELPFIKVVKLSIFFLMLFCYLSSWFPKVCLACLLSIVSGTILCIE